MSQIPNDLWWLTLIYDTLYGFEPTTPQMLWNEYFTPFLPCRFWDKTLKIHEVTNKNKTSALFRATKLIPIQVKQTVSPNNENIQIMTVNNNLY